MNDSEHVYIIGVGAQTSLGRTAATTAAAVRAGISGASEHPTCIDRSGEPMVVCRAPWLPVELGGIERFVSLGTDAALAAVACVTNATGLRPISLLVGLPESRYGRPLGLDAGLTGRLVDRLSQRAAIGQVTALPWGHAAGLVALDQARASIQRGDTDMCLVGGIDSYLEVETLEWIEDSNQLHSNDNSWGFIPGEAAGFLLLASPRAAHILKARALARLLGSGTSREECMIKTRTVCVGLGLTRALRQALSSSPEAAPIDQVVCDLNGEPYRADEFAFASVRLTKHLATPGEFIAPASRWGDVGAASGPLFAALAVESASRGYARGPRHVLCASSEGGHRGAAYLAVEFEGNQPR
jgi:3-oxoacyl-[acyl-carrier-protein] synthase-1